MSVTIYHNPACGTSRNVLALIRAAGEEPLVIEYLHAPPSRTELVALIGRMGMAVRDVLRRKGTPYDALSLGDPALTDGQLIDAMMAHPILMNRPIVVTSKGVKLCRPSDVVLDLLPTLPGGHGVKDDGTRVLTDLRIQGSDAGLRAGLEAADLPVDDLDEPGRIFFVYHTLGGALVGYGGYEVLGHDALIRSMVVPPAERGKGAGGAILALLLRRAFDEGARKAWLLTSSAAGFFEKSGFRRSARDAAPAEILATRQAAALCPASATLLTRGISL